MFPHDLGDDGKSHAFSSLVAEYNAGEHKELILDDAKCDVCEQRGKEFITRTTTYDFSETKYLSVLNYPYVGAGATAKRKAAPITGFDEDNALIGGSHPPPPPHFQQGPRTQRVEIQVSTGGLLLPCTSSMRKLPVRDPITWPRYASRPMTAGTSTANPPTSGGL